MSGSRAWNVNQTGTYTGAVDAGVCHFTVTAAAVIPTARSQTTVFTGRTASGSVGSGFVYSFMVPTSRTFKVSWTSKPCPADAPANSRFFSLKLGSTAMSTALVAFFLTSGVGSPQTNSHRYWQTEPPPLQAPEMGTSL